jgi:hypothetical protein
LPIPGSLVFRLHRPTWNQEIRQEAWAKRED